jgi:hypothetical protein
MGRFFPEQTWRICTGPAGTMIVSDAEGYHRGGKPTRGNRLLIVYTYTSSIPNGSRSFTIEGSVNNLDRLQKHVLHGKLSPLNDEDSDRRVVKQKIAKQLVTCKGIHADGWIAEYAQVQLKGGRGQNILTIDGFFPALGRDSTVITLATPDCLLTQRRIGPGDFHMNLPVQYERNLHLQIHAEGVRVLPAPDGRLVSVLIKNLELVSQ